MRDRGQSLRSSPKSYVSLLIATCRFPFRNQFPCCLANIFLNRLRKYVSVFALQGIPRQQRAPFVLLGFGMSLLLRISFSFLPISFSWSSTSYSSSFGVSSAYRPCHQRHFLVINFIFSVIVSMSPPLSSWSCSPSSSLMLLSMHLLLALSPSRP